METKQCNKCNEVKLITEYHKNGKYYYSICKQCKRQYRVENYERETEVRRKYYEINNDKIREQKREYRKGEVYKQYRINNTEKYKQYNIEYYKNNKDKVNKQKLKYFKTKYKSDILFRLSQNIRRGISLSFKKNGFTKKSRTYEILGCAYEEFKIHIESLWQPWMNWDNYGLYNGELNYGWDIDHIVPSSSSESEEDIIRLNHYSNLQPLCSKINRDIKRNKVD